MNSYGSSTVGEALSSLESIITIGAGLIAAVPGFVVVLYLVSLVVGEVSPARMVLCYQLCVLGHEYVWRTVFGSSFLLDR